jgi:hypothetical protein
MSTENQATQEVAPQDQISLEEAFAIFNTPIDEVSSFEEQAARSFDNSMFFEPTPEKGVTDQKTGAQNYTCVIKFLPNIYSPKTPIEKKTIYHLPIIGAPGKVWWFESPLSVGERCPVLTAWLENRNSTDARTKANANQLNKKDKACAIIQVIKDNNCPDNNGKIFLFRLTPGWDLWTILNSKVNPTKEEIDYGAVKENIFDIYSSNHMMLKCTKGSKGRDWSGSTWTTQKAGMFIPGLGGNGRFLTEADRNNKEILAMALDLLKGENANIKKHFSYKPADAQTLERVQKTLNSMFIDKVEIKSAPAATETPDPAATATTPAAPTTPAAQATTPAAQATTPAAPTTPAADPAVPPVAGTQVSDEEFLKTLTKNRCAKLHLRYQVLTEHLQSEDSN